MVCTRRGGFQQCGRVASNLLAALLLFKLFLGVYTSEQQSEEAFLATKNPLRVLSVLPIATQDDVGAFLYGRAALTVVFSRAVIALGSDWSGTGNNGTLAKELAPFNLQACEGQPEFAVKGKLRWATTSIARFDVEYDWPSDLCFDLVINPLLRTFDGLSISDNLQKTSWAFRTNPVSMYISYVRSEQAANLTGGRWTSTIFGQSGGHECPPDAVAYISFSSELHHATAFATLQSANEHLLPSPASDTYDKCGKNCIALQPRGLQNGKDYKLIFPKGGLYSAVAGRAGVERSVKVTGLQPFVFTFRSMKYSKLHYRRYDMYLRHGLERGVDSSIQLAALQTAIQLSSEGGPLLTHTVSLVDNATLRIECPDLQPSQRYALQVGKTDDVLDGFGQALQSSSVEFETADWPDSTLTASQSPAYFREFRSGWTALMRGDENTWRDNSGRQTPTEVRVWPVTSENFMVALAQRFSSREVYLPKADMEVIEAPRVNELRALSIDSSLLGGLFLQELQTSRYHTSKGFVSVSRFGLAFIATPANELVVWASHFDTGSAVSGVTIKVYRAQRWGGDQNTVSVVAQGETGADGLATLTPSGGSWQSSDYYSSALVALAETKDGALAFAEDVPMPTQTTEDSNIRAELVTDRSIYRPGDPLFLKGYLRSISANGNDYELLDADGSSFAVDVNWKNDQTGKQSKRTVVPLVAEYGTVSAELHVPSDEDEVTFGRIWLNLYRIPPRRLKDQEDEMPPMPPSPSPTEKLLASTVITVADPRPPTVALTISTTAKVVLPGPAASLNLGLHAMTYSGLAVEGAEVTLSWKLQRGRRMFEAVDEVTGMLTLPSTQAAKSSPVSFGYWRPSLGGGNSQAADATGQVTVTIGKDGITNYTLPVAELLQTAGENNQPVAPCEEGDSLSVTARWVGPTREVVTEELEDGAIMIARSPYTLAVTPARVVDSRLGLPLPGTPFPVYATVRDSSGGSIDTVDISMSLHEWDGKTPIREDPVIAFEGAESADLQKSAVRSGLLPVDSWGSQVGPGCTIAASANKANEAQCASELSLLAGKKYVVLARALAPDGVELVTAFAVGKTPSEWEARPLAGLDRSLTARLDKPEYHVGAEASLTFLSPFKDATALVVWGNGDGRKTQFQSLDGAIGSQHQITLSVGQECTFGCDVLVLLAAPSQPAEAVMPIAVPTSPLLDITLPRTAATSVRLLVPDVDRAFAPGSIQVAVAMQEESSAHAEVVQPGMEAFIRVNAPAGSEACVFLVDKAMLDVGGAANPHDVVKLEEEFELKRGDSLWFADTRDSLASEGGYNHTIKVTKSRASIDPWATDWYWPLLPNPWSLAPAEQTDAQYFAGKTESITEFPYASSWYSPWHGHHGNHGYDDYSSEGMGGGMPVPEAADDAGMAPPESRSAPMPAPPPPPSAASADPESKSASDSTTQGGGSSSKPGGKSVYVRTNFVATPVFVASEVVNADGVATVPFKMPDNIGTFEVRVYIVSGSQEHKFGHATNSIVSRRDVSMVSSVPRVVRPGDRFDCGVVVSRHGSAEDVGVYAKLLNSSSIMLRDSDLALYNAVYSASDGANVPLAAEEGSGPHEIVFPFQAMSSQQGAIGTTGFRFSIRLADGSTSLLDAMETMLPVKAAQAPVVVATSMALTASGDQERQWAEGLDLPEAMFGSGQLVLTAGVGNLPAVAVYTIDVISRKMRNGLELAAAVLPAAALSYYFAADTVQTPEVKAATNLDEAAKAFQHSMINLYAYTDTGYRYPLGLMWSKNGRSWSWSRASVSLNSFGLIAAQLVSIIGTSTATGPQPESDDGTWATLHLSVPYDLTAAWKRAVETELQRQVEELHYSSHSRCNSDCFKSWGTLAEVRAALGCEWVPESRIAQEELSMDRLFSTEALESLGPSGLAHAALAYTLHECTSELPSKVESRLGSVYERLVSHIRVQGATAYVARSAGSPHSAGLGNNALVLLAVARAGDAAQAEYFAGDSGSSLVAKLAEYVARGGRASLGYSVGTREAAFASVALAAYDHAMGSTNPELELTASSGDMELLAYEAIGAGAAPASSSTRWESLASPPAPVNFVISGQGQASVSAALTFVPANIPMLGAVYRGIYVEKVVRSMDPVTGEAVGPPLQIAELGSSVVVTIQITTPDDLSRVILEDRAAGGLEPVDPNVAGDDTGSEVSNGCGDGMGRWWSWWCVPSFYFRETYSDRVVWSSWDTLQAGTHTVSYQAVAASRGIFTLPSAQAYVDEQPEVMGLSQGGTIVVAGMKHSPESHGTDQDDDEDVFKGLLATSVPMPSDQVATDEFLSKLEVQPNSKLPPKDCIGGCPEGASCQVSTGQCLCWEIFSGWVLCSEESELTPSPSTPTPSPTPGEEITTELTSESLAGSTVISVATTEGFAVGDPIVISSSAGEEVNTIKGFSSIHLLYPLKYNHPVGTKLKKLLPGDPLIAKLPSTTMVSDVSGATNANGAWLPFCWVFYMMAFYVVTFVLSMWSL